MGKAVRATMETHPRRRRACALWYCLHRDLEGFRPQGDWEPCLRGLAFYTKEWVDILRVHAVDGSPRVTADETALANTGLWLDEDDMLRETIKGEGSAENAEDVAMESKVGASGNANSGKGHKNARGGQGSGKAATPEKRKAEQMVEELEKEQNDGESAEVPGGDPAAAGGDADL